MNRDLLFPVDVLRFADSLRTRFIQANTQFHLLLLDSRQAPIDIGCRFPVHGREPVPGVLQLGRDVPPDHRGHGRGDHGRQPHEGSAGRGGQPGRRLLRAHLCPGSRENAASGGSTSASSATASRSSTAGAWRWRTCPQIKLAAIEPVPGKVRLELENFYMIGQGEQRSGLVRVSLSAAREDEKPQILAQDMEDRHHGKRGDPYQGTAARKIPAGGAGGG